LECSNGMVFGLKKPNDLTKMEMAIKRQEAALDRGTLMESVTRTGGEKRVNAAPRSPETAKLPDSRTTGTNPLGHPRVKAWLGNQFEKGPETQSWGLKDLLESLCKEQRGPR